MRRLRWLAFESTGRIRKAGAELLTFAVITTDPK
jgi:hypothetical protein